MELSHWASQKELCWTADTIPNKEQGYWLLWQVWVIKVHFDYSESARSQKTHTTEEYMLYSHEHYHNRFITRRKTTKEEWWPFFTKSPEEKESLSYKKGHFETQHVARNRTINTASLTVWREKTFQTSTRALHNNVKMQRCTTRGG